MFFVCFVPVWTIVSKHLYLNKEFFYHFAPFFRNRDDIGFPVCNQDYIGYKGCFWWPCIDEKDIPKELESFFLINWKEWKIKNTEFLFSNTSPLFYLPYPLAIWGFGYKYHILHPLQKIRHRFGGGWFRIQNDIVSNRHRNGFYGYGINGGKKGQSILLLFFCHFHQYLDSFLFGNVPIHFPRLPYIDLRF